jgi:hypothetical protein
MGDRFGMCERRERAHQEASVDLIQCIRAHREHVGLSALLQHAPQPRVRSVEGVRQHPGAGRPGVKRGSDQRAGDLRLGREGGSCGTTALARLGSGSV